MRTVTIKERVALMMFYLAAQRKYVDLGLSDTSPCGQVRVVKNGDRHEVQHLEVYRNLPKCWIEGNQYFFRSRIVYREFLAIPKNKSSVTPKPYIEGTAI